MRSRFETWLLRRLGGRLTYSQLGEDILVDGALRLLGIEMPTYLDIGAYHPTALSNTAMFYARGCRGVCVEPDPTLFEVIRKGRKGDVCLNAGIGGDAATTAPFYVMSARALNTFSKETADRLVESEGFKIDRIINVPLIPVNDILAKHFQGHPNFLSVDAEEYDLRILESIDFARFRPEVICVETLIFSGARARLRKDPAIPALLESKGYLAFADTSINTVFVDGHAWKSAPGYAL